MLKGLASLNTSTDYLVVLMDLSLNLALMKAGGFYSFLVDATPCIVLDSSLSEDAAEKVFLSLLGVHNIFMDDANLRLGKLVIDCQPYDSNLPLDIYVYNEAARQQPVLPAAYSFSWN